MMADALRAVSAPKLNEGELFLADSHFERLKAFAKSYPMDAVLGPLFGAAGVFGGGAAASVFFGDGFEVADDGSGDALVSAGLGLQAVDLGLAEDDYTQRWRRLVLLESTVLAIAPPGAATRIDRVCVRAVETDHDETSRAYMNEAGTESTETLDTRTLVDACEFRVVTGVEGSGVPPAEPSGFATLAYFQTTAGGVVTVTDQRTQARLLPPPAGLADTAVDTLDAGTLKANVLSLLQSGNNRSAIRAPDTFGGRGFSVHLATDGGAPDTPESCCFRVENGGLEVFAYVCGPDGFNGDPSATKAAGLVLGGTAGLGWLLLAYLSGGAPILSFRQSRAVGGAALERFAILDDGRTRLNGGAGVALVVRIPNQQAVPNDAAEWRILQSEWASYGSGGVLVYGIPEAYDTDGASRLLASVTAEVKNNGAGDADVDVTLYRYNNTDLAPVAMDTEAETISAGAAAEVTLTPDVGFTSDPKNTVFVAFDTSDADVTVKSVCVTYTVKRLPA